ncbi:CASP-like protein 4C1 [Typha angustifolia]|uniref:CASP-like protein 4C1 n=1 Tax=Typha angustifolia TaxID=59011 RepID=UPI003C2F1F19
MPSPLRNGGSTPHLVSPHLVSPHHYHFHSTVSEQKLRRLNWLTLLLRLAAFCFSLAAAVFMATDTSRSRSSNSPSWLDSDSFRFVFASNAIVALYSLFEVGVSVWEILHGSTLLPESMQLWFDFSHDQAFAYLVLSAGAAGTAEARAMRGSSTCAAEGAFCVQAAIAVALGFAGFAFLALAALVSGFRLVCYLVTGSRFPLSSF